MMQGFQSLSEKEKETLRLIVCGHDAKSMASHLNLSVHTINERLRAARRKLSVTSSREAARLLLELEQPEPKSLVDKALGDAVTDERSDQSQLPVGRHSDDQGNWRLFAGLIGGFLIMSILLALFLMSSPLPEGGVRPEDDTRTAEIASADTAMESAARQWLALADASDWSASFEATGTAFRNLNILAMWQAASERARAPLGRVLAREAINFQFVPTPPNGHEIVRFRTDFAERKGALETVTMEREDGRLKVVGYTID